MVFSITPSRNSPGWWFYLSPDNRQCPRLAPSILSALSSKKTVSLGEKLFRLQNMLVNSSFRFAHPQILRQSTDGQQHHEFPGILPARRWYAGAGIGKHHHAMPLLTQFMHDGDHFRAQRNNNSPPAGRTAGSLAVEPSHDTAPLRNASSLISPRSC